MMTSKSDRGLAGLAGRVEKPNAEDLERAHARARHHRTRLLAHDSSREVPSTMTEELFRRLTDAHAAPLTAPAGVTRYTYTPRKILRRVLDHALDHLNQIDQ
jgi:hypothetical protein